MSKYCVTVKTKCKDDIKLYTDDKSKIRELKNNAAIQAFLHERNCSKCASIRIYEKEFDKLNSVWKVESTVRCGEVLSIERRNPSEVEKASCERGICHQVAEHWKTCLKCIRIQKLDNIIKCQTK